MYILASTKELLEKFPFLAEYVTQGKNESVEILSISWQFLSRMRKTKWMRDKNRCVFEEIYILDGSGKELARVGIHDKAYLKELAAKQSRYGTGYAPSDCRAFENTGEALRRVEQNGSEARYIVTVYGGKVSFFELPEGCSIFSQSNLLYAAIPNTEGL